VKCPAGNGDGIELRRVWADGDHVGFDEALFEGGACETGRDGGVGTTRVGP
jgi:hypothetical protein